MRADLLPLAGNLPDSVDFAAARSIQASRSALGRKYGLGDQTLIADGEVVAYRDGQVLPFAMLQKRLGRKKPTARLTPGSPTPKSPR